MLQCSCMSPIEKIQALNLLPGNGEGVIFHPEFFDMHLCDQISLLAFTHGCPRPRAVIEEYGKIWAQEFHQANQYYPDPERIWIHGAQAARARYAECNTVFSIAVAEAAKVNPSLYWQIISPVPRLSSEPAGVFEEGRVSEDYNEFIPPMSAVTGYFLPRGIIEEMGRGTERTGERIIKAMDILNRELKRSRDQYELAARVANAVIYKNLKNPARDGDADSVIVLQHLLPAGILEEQNTLTMYKKLFKQIQIHSPILATLYNQLGSIERQKSGIANF